MHYCHIAKSQDVSWSSNDISKQNNKQNNKMYEQPKVIGPLILKIWFLEYSQIWKFSIFDFSSIWNAPIVCCSVFSRFIGFGHNNLHYGHYNLFHIFSSFINSHFCLLDFLIHFKYCVWFNTEILEHCCKIIFYYHFEEEI